jgi:hypothetical protein
MYIQSWDILLYDTRTKKPARRSIIEDKPVYPANMTEKEERLCVPNKTWGICIGNKVGKEDTENK